MAQVDRETERIQTFRSLFLSLDENGQETALILLMHSGLHNPSQFQAKSRRPLKTQNKDYIVNTRP